MYRIFLLLLFILAAFPKAWGIDVSVNHSLYYLPDPIYNGNMNPYIELYWQVNPTTLHFKTNEQKQITGQILTDVLITNDTGKIIKEDHYIFETLPCSNANELATLNILELKRYFMLAGHVRIRLKLTDVNDTTNVFSYNDTFTVPPLSKSPFISDISFIDTFFESDIRTPFRKNGMQFIPLCQPFFDD